MSQVALVLIKDATVDARQVGTATFYSQRGVLVTSPDEAIGIEVSLPRSQSSGYPVGRYYISGESFDRDQYGRPCFGKRGLHLIPAPAAAPAPVK